jgi:hypothetical protein
MEIISILKLVLLKVANLMCSLLCGWCRHFHQCLKFTLLHSHPLQPRHNPHSSLILGSAVIVIAITIAITDRLGSTQHHRIGLSSVCDKVLTSVVLEHDSPVSVCTNTATWPMIYPWLDPYSVALRPDPPVWVYTNTSVLAYDLFVIRSLFPSHWSTTRLCPGEQHRRFSVWTAWS